MSLPNIPDNIYKILVLIGGLCIFYSFIKGERDTDNYYRRHEQYVAEVDGHNLKILEVESKREKLIDIARKLSKKYGIKNPITQTDSIISFEQVLAGSKNEVMVFVSIVVPKLTLFDMQVKRMFMHSSELCQSDFTKPPKVFNTVDMVASIGKFITAMLYPKMLFISIAN